jgi:hypothetical protein
MAASTPSLLSYVYVVIANDATKLFSKDAFLPMLSPDEPSNCSRLTVD